MDLTGDAVGNEGSQAVESSLEDGSCEDDVSGEGEGEGEEEEGEGCDGEEGEEQEAVEGVCGDESAGAGKSEDGDDEECQLCSDTGHLVVCDICALSYHAACVGLSTMPGNDDNWLCPSCMDSRNGEHE